MAQTSRIKMISSKLLTLRANLFKSQAVGDIQLYDPLRFAGIFLGEGLGVDRRIPNFQVLRPKVFF